MRELYDLFVVFMRIGGFTFGGGYAMLPMLEREVVESRHWATEEELMDYYAIGQCTPGVIAINTATFIGYKRKGVVGAITACLGVITPSLIIIMAVSAFLSNFMGMKAVASAFAGIRACVCVLIFDAVSRLAKKSLIDGPTRILYLLILGLSLFTPISPALLVILAGLAGILLKGKKHENTD